MQQSKNCNFESLKQKQKFRQKKMNLIDLNKKKKFF